MEKIKKFVKSKKLLNLLKWVWAIAVIAGALYYFFKNYQDISVYLKTISLSRVLLSFVMLFIGKFTLSEITRVSLRKVGYSITYPEALSITSVTQLGKYLPGGIWHVAGKFGIYKARKISTKNATLAVVFENFWLLSSATVIGGILLVVSSRDALCEFNSLFCNPSINWAIALGLPVIWMVGLYIVDRLSFKENRYKVKDVLILILEMIVIWVSFGVSFWLVFPIHAGFLLAITGAFSISWVAGYVAFFAPGGIGIREYLLTILLASFFLSGEVAIYATIHRLIWVLGEIILGAGSVLLFGIPMTENEVDEELPS